MSVGRLAQRAWFLNNMPFVFSEVVYHRLHKQELGLPGGPVWQWGKQEGAIRIVATERPSTVE